MERTEADILDEILVLAAQNGNQDAFSALVRRWHPRLLRHAVLVSLDSQRGADAAQDAWVSILKKIHRLRDPARFGPWAFRIVTNKCRDESRRAARRGEKRGLFAGDAVSAPAVGPARDDPDEVSRLRVAIRGVSADQRAILSLRYVDQLTVPAIAAVLGVPAGTVKSRLHAARGALRAVLDPGSALDSGPGG